MPLKNHGVDLRLKLTWDSGDRFGSIEDGPQLLGANSSGKTRINNLANYFLHFFCIFCTLKK